MLIGIYFIASHVLKALSSCSVEGEEIKDEVVVDFNHPLAGRTVTFEVAVITVEAVEE